MTYRKHIAKLSLIAALLLIPTVFVVTGVVGASEVVGTLSGGSGNTIIGTVGGGSDVSGTIGGTSGGSTIIGTVSSGSGGGGSSGGGGGGGGSNINTPGSVLGVNTDVSNIPNGGGSVLGVSTNVPNTGAGGNAMLIILLILILSLVAGLGTYTISRRIIN